MTEEVPVPFDLQELVKSGFSQEAVESVLKDLFALGNKVEMETRPILNGNGKVFVLPAEITIRNEQPQLANPEALSKRELSRWLKKLPNLWQNQKALYQDLANKEAFLKHLLESLSYFKCLDLAFLGKWEKKASFWEEIFGKVFDQFVRTHPQLEELREKKEIILHFLHIAKVPQISNPYTNHVSASVYIPKLVKELEELEDNQEEMKAALLKSLSFAQKQILSEKELEQALLKNEIAQLDFDVWCSTLSDLKQEQLKVCKEIWKLENHFSKSHREILCRLHQFGEMAQKLRKLFEQKVSDLTQQIADQEVLVNDAESALFQFFDENDLVNFLKLSDAPEVVKVIAPSDEAAATQDDEELLFDF